MSKKKMVQRKSDFSSKNFTKFDIKPVIHTKQWPRKTVKIKIKPTIHHSLFYRLIKNNLVLQKASQKFLIMKTIRRFTNESSNGNNQSLNMSFSLLLLF